MRVHVILLIVSLAGVLGGAALIGLPVLGGAVIFDSLALGVYALFHDDGQRAAPSVHEVPSLSQVLEEGAGVVRRCWAWLRRPRFSWLDAVLVWLIIAAGGLVQNATGWPWWLMALVIAAGVGVVVVAVAFAHGIWEGLRG